MPSETAHVIARIAPNLPARTRRTLSYLLSRDLAEEQIEGPNAAARLGLLSDLITERQGEFPTVENYDDYRRASDEHWPSGSTLIRSYGSWTLSVRTASLLSESGTAPRRVSGYPNHPYRREELIYSVVRFRHDLGYWPTNLAEYSKWAMLVRSMQIRWGNTHARIATGSVVRSRPGSLARLVRGAQLHSR